MINIIEELEKFRRFRYIDESHYYIDLENPEDKYTSGTGFIKKFQIPFDNNLAHKSAQKLGLSVEEVLELWSVKAKIGTTRGTIVHNYCENLWNNKVFKDNHPSWILYRPEQEVITYKRSVDICKKQALEFYNAYRGRYIPLRPELVIGDSELKIASMIDLPVYDRILDCVGLIDYKTDLKMEKVNNWGKKMLEPVSHLDDCEFTKYSIQLELYKHIIQKNTAIEIGFKKVIWFNAENSTFTVIDTMDLSRELKIMLECHGE
jgi:hypothetical protein